MLAPMLDVLITTCPVAVVARTMVFAPATALAFAWTAIACAAAKYDEVVEPPAGPGSHC